ncbi:MAG TPA: hypothetical protein VEJ67_15865 [Candidatus Cybelea sp.]|nr:hypothetical protein [Candidatus Cybelea sp.]
MKSITVGMIIYCLICAVVVAGISLYQDLKREKELPTDEPSDARAGDHAPDESTAASKTSPHNHSGNRAA